MNSRPNYSDQRGFTVRGENLHKCHFVRHKSNTTSPGIEPGGRPQTATNAEVHWRAPDGSRSGCKDLDWIRVAQDVCEVGRCLPVVGDTSGSCVQTISSTLESDWRAITGCLAPGPPGGSTDTCWVRPTLCDRSRKVPLISCNTQNRRGNSDATTSPPSRRTAVQGSTCYTEATGRSGRRDEAIRILPTSISPQPICHTSPKPKRRSARRYWLATWREIRWSELEGVEPWNCFPWPQYSQWFCLLYTVSGAVANSRRYVAVKGEKVETRRM
jgi:hypothetical protein